MKSSHSHCRKVQKALLRNKKFYCTEESFTTQQKVLLCNRRCYYTTVRDRAPGPFYDVLGQTHVNGWSRVVASQNGGSTSYIFPFRLRVLQWSRHLFNYWKNKKTIFENFLILLIWNWIYIDHRKITWL